jgi:hypothetical protein
MKDVWECSSGRWQVQNRRSIPNGKAIVDPDRPIRRPSTRSHRPTRHSSNGNSCRGSLSSYTRSNALQLKALALSTSCPPDMRPGIRLRNNETDEGGTGPLRLRGLRLADPSTLLHPRSDNRSDRVLSNTTARISHNDLDLRTDRNSDRSIARRRPVLLAPKSAQNPILLVC